MYMADGHEAFRGLVERIKGGLAYNVIELMRLENDKVVEHWDIFQRLDGVQTANTNGFW